MQPTNTFNQKDLLHVIICLSQVNQLQISEIWLSFLFHQSFPWREAESKISVLTNANNVGIKSDILRIMIEWEMWKGMSEQKSYRQLVTMLTRCDVFSINHIHDNCDENCFDWCANIKMLVTDDQKWCSLCCIFVQNRIYSHFVRPQTALPMSDHAVWKTLDLLVNV